jgi:hypothetical protein
MRKSLGYDLAIALNSQMNQNTSAFEVAAAVVLDEGLLAVVVHVYNTTERNNVVVYRPLTNLQLAL